MNNAAILDKDEYLGNRAFALAISAALMLHLSALLIWHLTPKTPVVQIPVRALNIKLGDGDAMEEPPAPAAPALPGDGPSRLVRDDTADTEARAKALSDAMAKLLAAENKPDLSKNTAGNLLDEKLAASKPKAKAPPKSPSRAQDKGTFDRRDEGVKSSAPIMPISSAPTEYIRPSHLPKTAGSVLGNSEQGATPATLTYKQVVSLWIEKFKTKVQLPAGAPDTVEIVVAVRIDRQGNISSPVIETSSGYASLDYEAMSLIKRANPVPPAPDDYEPGETSFAFKIPITFKK